MKKLTEQQIKELDEKLGNFEKHIESSIESEKEWEKEQVNTGEYSYLVETHMEVEEISLNEELDSALEKSSISKEDLIQKVINDNLFVMEYEELSSPFQYGGSNEDEFNCIQWGGDKEIQFERESLELFKPSFNLKDFFESYTAFEELVRFEIGSINDLDMYWKLATTSNQTLSTRYNTDYDVVRCLIDPKENENLIKYLKENPKEKEKFEPKKITITTTEYHDLVSNHCGFCIKCGEINEHFHEPDAQNYRCESCEAEESFGVSQALIMGLIEIKDEE